MEKFFIKDINKNILNYLLSLFPKKSIKIKIIFTCMILIILSSLVICYFAISMTKNDKKRSLAERMESICITMSDTVAENSNNILEEIERISNSNELNTYITDFDDKYITQLFVDKSNLFYEISFINMDYAEELKVYNGEESGDYISFDNDENFINFVKSQNNKYIYSDEFILENTPCIRVFYKLEDEYHDVIGYLNCVLKIKLLIEDIILKEFENAGFVYVVNQKGIVLHHINKDNVFKALNEKGDKKSKTVLSIQQMSNGFLRCNLMDIDGWIYYMPQKDFKWSIIATLPYKEFIKPINKFLFNFIIIVIISLFVCLFFINFISNKITKGLRLVTDKIEKISKGQIIQLKKINIKQKDEVGILINSFNIMLDSLSYKLSILKEIADNNNLRINVNLASDQDALGEALSKMLISLNDILNQINNTTVQISTSASQVASVSQSLSQGATEQASLLEEITAAIAEINSQSKNNYESANNANKLTKKATENAQTSNNFIKKLVEAMNKIIESSKEINKVTKVIDDIAFQTNILSLNANVEAARAGKYGKAFAVVAEEVRELSARSTEAVKKTSLIIKNSLENIEDGNKLVIEVSKQLEGIASSTKEVYKLVEEIVIASKEQTQGLDNISLGLNQIEQVTQVNTASAEESASTSEEFASQSQLLKRIVSKFKLKEFSENLH